MFIAPGSSFLAASPSLFKKLAFDPVNDFEHVTTLSKLPFILVVAGDSPYKSVAELTAYLKQQGDKASYASVANTGLVSSELYKAKFGLNTVEVKYKDAMARRSTICGGTTSRSRISTRSRRWRHLKTGKLRALATASKERFKALPDIPSARKPASPTRTSSLGGRCMCRRARQSRCVRKARKMFNEIAIDDDTKTFLANSRQRSVPWQLSAVEGPSGQATSRPGQSTSRSRRSSRIREPGERSNKRAPGDAIAVASPGDVCHQRAPRNSSTACGEALA